jgi:GT2 family glycosyltransferase
MEKMKIFESGDVFVTTPFPVGEVDLIVLSYNGLGASKKFLEHFSANTNQEICRLIWIDNGSSDGSKEFLNDYFEKNLKNAVNKGVIGGRNLGYKISQEINGRSSPHKYLMFLDNDQYVYENWLEHHLKILNSGYDLVGVEAWQLNDWYMPMRKISHINETFSYVGCGGMIIRREATDKIGMFDERFNPAYFEDPDFCFKAYDAGFKIGWNCKAKIVHMPHQTLGVSPERQKIIISSHSKFRAKWGIRKPPILRQRDLLEFH